MCKNELFDWAAECGLVSDGLRVRVDSSTLVELIDVLCRAWACEFKLKSLDDGLTRLVLLLLLLLGLGIKVLVLLLLLLLAELGGACLNEFDLPLIERLPSKAFLSMSNLRLAAAPVAASGRFFIHTGRCLSTSSSGNDLTTADADAVAPSAVCAMGAWFVRSGGT